MKLKDLKPNKRNPRKITAKQLEMLKASLFKYGDLSGIVFNRGTRNLVSGHQRQKSLPSDAKIVIEKKYETPTHAFTVAEGYVEFGDERIKYREVDASPEWETEALLAANAHGGTWDSELLKVVIADFPGIDLWLAGFDIPKLKSLNIEIKMPELPKEPVKGWDEQSDAEYVKNEEIVEERIPTETIPAATTTEAFESVNENTQPSGRRIVLIIDCPTDEVKASLKEKLLQPVKEAGAKFF